ncbi:MAG: PhzF family phenazine biosynthesis protein [Acidobacteriota bacterium]
MPEFPFLQIDAFANQRFHGNACAVVLDSDELTDETNLKIAREFNLAETAFVRTSSMADFGVRFFTPAEEIPLAGHPTIATVFALVETGRIKLRGAATIITLELRAGVIEVEIHAFDHQPMRIVMSQLKPKFMRTYEHSNVLPSFGLSEGDLLTGVPIQTVSTGTPQLMVPLRSLEALQKARLNTAAYELFHQTSDFFSPHLFCLTGATSRGQTFARHFGTAPDLPEDAFTGSATGGMAAYLWRYNLIERPTFVAEQGHWMNRPGEAIVEIVGPREDITTVKIGGSAVTVMRGQLLL